MAAFMPLLATCGQPIHSHDAWPLAILYLEELDVAATMRVFRDHDILRHALRKRSCHS
jgi:hypothetical protein